MRHWAEVDWSDETGRKCVPTGPRRALSSEARAGSRRRRRTSSGLRMGSAEEHRVSGAGRSRTRGTTENSGVTPGFSLGRQARCPEPKNTDRQQEWHDATCAPTVDGLLYLQGDAKEPGEHTGVGLGGRCGHRFRHLRALGLNLAGQLSPVPIQ